MVGIGLAAFGNMTALSSEGMSRPFDVRRDGFVCAEGGAALVLEDLDHARARGARIYAELWGGSTADAHHITAPAPGDGAAACMELALADAAVPTRPSGTSTPTGPPPPSTTWPRLRPSRRCSAPVAAGDLHQGRHRPCPRGAGALEAVATTLTIDRRLIPPTAGYEQPDPEIHLDVVHGQPRPWEPAPALSNSFGFGGHNGCLVIGPPPA